MSQEDNYPIIDYYAGLDIGQPGQYTALAIVEARKGYRGFDNYGHFEDFLFKPDEVSYSVTYLERFKPGTSYPDQVKLLADRLGQLPTAGKGSTHNGRASVRLAADVTGTGQPVFDLIKKANLEPTAISMTNGEGYISTENGFAVPKRDLISTVQVLMQERRLKVAQVLELGRLLASELEGFTFRVKLPSPETAAEWRDGKQDDLIFAVAVAAWLAAHAADFQITFLADSNPEVYDLLTNWRGY